MKKATSVFYISASIILALVVIGALIPKAFEQFTANVQGFLTDSFGWYYLIIVTCFVAVCLYLLFSPMGKIKLGKAEDKPEFSRPTWLAMLFSAGVGIGLVFYGTAEPISHYAISSPTGETGTNTAIREAMQYTFFHWGIHAWAVYGLVAMTLAYFMFRRGEPGLISATLKPILGRHASGGIGKTIDVIAVISTVIGVATSLGFGAVQINGGLSYLFGVPSNMTTQFIIILAVTVLFMISALTGLGKGIKILSNVNMLLAAGLLALVFIFGPTLFTLNLFTDTIGRYLQNFLNMSFRISPLNEENRAWINGWTIFYWAWWISWSPFVGIFIARVSKGRTIREFVAYVLLAPSLLGFLWFSVFGGSAISLEQSGQTIISALATEQSLFGMLDTFPFGHIISIFAICLIGTFFITSADSGTFVLGMMTTNGSQNPNNMLKMVWGALLTSIALVLLYSGGLQALQNTMIIAAFPFSFVIIMMASSLLKSLKQDAKETLPAKRKTSPILEKKA
ncbi:glycine betaine uptake BCCT transporter [Saccharibacillus kuerlensis]|uniref:Glycine betaine transporter OpuD n=1 Tax=Saccharibacillus kuerlensis TaxID=459527 RepID=A0ABQ2L1I5_9BACL|nr:BCCT family transporter [Saccharibacillus kuerlensis]GGN98006.1 glycine betaine transporter OpuD [Saccharibacillus kuerlensis]